MRKLAVKILTMNSQFIPQQIENEDVRYNITFVYLESLKRPYTCIYYIYIYIYIYIIYILYIYIYIYIGISTVTIMSTLKNVNF